MWRIHAAKHVGASYFSPHEETLLIVVLVSVTSGYSRFPVCEPGNPTYCFCWASSRQNRLRFFWFLQAEVRLEFVQLLAYDPSKGLPVSAFALSILPGTSVHQLLANTRLFVCGIDYSRDHAFWQWFTAKLEELICFWWAERLAGQVAPLELLLLKVCVGRLTSTSDNLSY